MKYSFDTVKSFMFLCGEATANFLSPPRCAYCKVFLDTRTIFCSRCFLMIKPIVSKDVHLTQKYRMNVLAVSDYQEPLRSLILAKGRSDKLASEQLGELIWSMTHLSTIPCDYLVPVPLHWMRFANRGFNQAEEIAKVLAQKSGKPLSHLLTRSKQTAFQYGLRQKERHSNVHQVFTLNVKDRSLYKGKHLVLVDDLLTTGATVCSAAHQLRLLRPASISVVVACRVV